MAAYPHELSHDHAASDDRQIRGQTAATTKAAEDGEVIADQGQKDIRYEVEFIVFEQRDAAAARGVLNHEHDQHQIAIDEALPRKWALAKAIL
jgi:hypothetical protein